MPGQDHLNWDQHRLTEKSVKGIQMSKDGQDILARAVSGGHPLIVRYTGKGHIQVLVKDDGMVITSGSGGRGSGNDNFESELRRAHRSVGKDFPRKNESMKQFQRRMAKNQETTQGNEPETP